MNENDMLAALARAISPYVVSGRGQKAIGVPSETAYLYEEGGLFGRCDGPSTLINAMVGPIGIEGMIPWIGNFTEKEFVETLTQVQEASSTEQSTACGDCIRVRTKACAQFYCFGRFCRQTDELQFDRLGVHANANVPVKTLFGSISDANGNVLVPMGSRIDDAFFLQSRLVGYALRFKNAQLIWTGNPANNNGTNSYAEYQGLQLIVNTGKFDAYTQLLCTALDSFLMNFAFNNPSSTGTYAIQQWFRRMVLQFMTRAGGAGFDWATARLLFAMTNNMWDCVARAFACDGLDLCGVTTDRGLAGDPDQARARYEEYLTRMMLPVFGRWYPVVIDTQIPETTGQANGICSDIYALTTDINGEAVLYGEYQDFNQTYGRVRQELAAMFGSDDIAITDNGRYALIRDNERGCFDVQAYTKPRLVSLAPWLLGRIQNVCCNVLQEPLPAPTLSGSVYEKGCGRYTVPQSVLYGPCD